MSSYPKVRHLRRPADASLFFGRRLRANWLAQIECAGKTVECIVLEVSSNGAKLQTTHSLKGLAELSLVLEGRDAISATIMWQRKDQIGLLFHEDQKWVLELFKQRFDPAAWVQTSCRA